MPANRMRDAISRSCPQDRRQCAVKISRRCDRSVDTASLRILNLRVSAVRFGRTQIPDPAGPEGCAGRLAVLQVYISGSDNVMPNLHMARQLGRAHARYRNAVAVTKLDHRVAMGVGGDRRRQFV